MVAEDCSAYEGIRGENREVVRCEEVVWRVVEVEAMVDRVQGEKGFERDG